jgi:hypothetical protein
MRMIVIPMAGLSSRFTAAGYKLPKYMLKLGAGTVFDCAVKSFAHYFDSVPFLFVARAEADTAAFVTAACSALGIVDARIQILDAPTSGQAETVELGLRAADVSASTPVTIFNIDTFRPGFRFPTGAWWTQSDGYLEVFRGSGQNWSYVGPAPEGNFAVAETTEKRPISDLCCTGLYHFSIAEDFFAALAAERQKPSAPELYVAPLYNHLIAEGRRIHYEVTPTSDIIFCGIPAEYEAAIKRMESNGL